MAHPDVLIVGGGVIGLTTAYYLATEGASVTVIDQAQPGRAASWAGAGIIPPGNPERAMHDYDVLRATSSRMYPALSAALRDETGIDNGYHVCGGIELLEPDEPDPCPAWHAEGIAFGPVLHEHEPGLRAERGHFLPDMAQVRNPWHLRALLAACVRRGVKVLANVEAVGGGVGDGRFDGLATSDNRVLLADKYLIASGAWSGMVARHTADIDVAVAPVLGQMVLFNPPRPVLRRVVCVGRAYLVPRQDGRVLVGSTEEPEAGFDVRTTDDAIARLTAFARRMVPALATAPVETTWAGLRPGTSDGLPYLGPVPGLRNLFVAAGHYRAGIQLSPATGRAMADLLLGRKPFVPLDAFRLDRPAAATFQPTFRS